MRSVVQPICALVVLAAIVWFLLFLTETQRTFGADPMPLRCQDVAMSCKAAEQAEATLPRDRWDPAVVVKGVGKNSKKLLAWVKANSVWIPYRGSLRGPVGVLMDG